MGVVPARADMLVLTDGRVLEGKFVAGSETFIQFRTAEGLQSIALDQISSLHLKPGADTSHAAAVVVDSGIPSAQAVEPAALAPGAVLVPAGTKLQIRFDKEITTSSHDVGASFQAVLMSDLQAEGQVVAAKGSIVQGRVAEVRGGKKLGTQVLRLSLTSVSLHNQKVPLVTGNFGLERGTGQAPRLVGAEQAAGPGGELLDMQKFADGSDKLKIPKGALLQVPLREPAALFP